MFPTIIPIFSSGFPTNIPIFSPGSLFSSGSPALPYARDPCSPRLPYSHSLSYVSPTLSQLFVALVVRLIVMMYVLLLPLHNLSHADCCDVCPTPTSAQPLPCWPAIVVSNDQSYARDTCPSYALSYSRDVCPTYNLSCACGTQVVLNSPRRLRH